MSTGALKWILSFLVACPSLHGQPQPNWLRVGLRVDSTEEHIRDLFTRELRKLGDVEVVPLLVDHYPLGSSEVHDVRLKVLVSEAQDVQELSPLPTPPRRYAVAVIVSRPAEKVKQTLPPDATTSEAWQKGFISVEDLQKEMIAASWLVVAEEKDLESACANLVSKIDHDVLEADRKRIRFPEPLRPESRGSGRAGSGPGKENRVTTHCDVVPSLIEKVEAEYSDEASKANYQGTVLLSVEVDPTGHVVNPRIVRSVGLGLDEKAIEAVRQWRFQPGSSTDGKPVSCLATIEVIFRLGKK